MYEVTIVLIILICLPFVVEYFKNSTKIIDSDKVKVREMLHLLKPVDLDYLLRDMINNIPISEQIVLAIANFLDVSNRTDRQITNKKLKESFLNFRDSLHKYFLRSGDFRVPLHNGNEGLYGFDSDFRNLRYDEYHKAVKELDQLATKAHNDYTSLMKFIGERHIDLNDKEQIQQKESVVNANAGRDVNLGDKIVHHINNIQIEKAQNNLKTFENLIENSHWSKETIDNKELWICEADATYQIQKGEEFEKFSEEWTRKFPDVLGSGKYSIYLTIGRTNIKSYIFISADGGRIFVPIPKLKVRDSKNVYNWDRTSIEFKIGEIIGEFYRHNSLEGVAKIAGIEIR